MKTRLVLEDRNSWEDQLTAAIIHEEVCICVAEEQADGSYNRHYECKIHLDKEKAIQLAHWLTCFAEGCRS